MASFSVNNQLYRFNILNGLNNRPYKITFSDNSKMIQRVTEGGYIHKPQQLYYFVIYTEDRINLLIDFFRYEENDKIIMKNLFSTDQCEE